MGRLLPHHHILAFDKQVLSKARAAEKAEPDKYKQLTPSDISRLCQVQLQLSCGCGIVEDEGAIDPADVGILASLLGHQLTHLQLVELNDFEVQSKKVAESLAASREILILLVTKTGRLHQLVKKTMFALAATVSQAASHHPQFCLRFREVYLGSEKKT